MYVVNYVTFTICYRNSVCLSSVTLVRPTQPVKIFRNFVSPYDSPGTLVFWCQNSLVEEAPFPLKFAFKVTHPLSNSTISTNIYVYSSRRQNRPTARIKKTNRQTDKQTNKHYN